MTEFLCQATSVLQFVALALLGRHMVDSRHLVDMRSTRFRTEIAIDGRCHPK